MWNVYKHSWLIKPSRFKKEWRKRVHLESIVKGETKTLSTAVDGNISADNKQKKRKPLNDL